MIALSSKKNTERLDLISSDMPSLQSFESEGDTVNESFKDYKTAIANSIERNLSLLDELPPMKTLRIEELKEHFRKLVEDYFTKSPILEKSVEISRYTNNMSKYIESYFKEIFRHHENIKKRLDEELFDVSRMYFNSDLPLLFLTIMEDAILVEKDYLDTYDKRIHKEHSQLLFNRNNERKFKQLCDAHNRWIRPFTERLKTLERTRVKLFWYTDFSNSATVDKIFEVKTIKSSALDMKIIQGFIDDLHSQIQEIGVLIGPEMEFSPFMSYEKNAGARSIRKIMELINTSEG
jgi:hypothetical protein